MSLEGLRPKVVTFTGENVLVKGELFADLVGTDSRLRIIDWREVGEDGRGSNLIQIGAWLEKKDGVADPDITPEA